MPRVLLVDDDAELLATLALALTKRGMTVTTCADPRAAEEAAQGCDVVVTDLRMPGLTGLALARRLASLPKPPALVVLTAFGAMDDAVRALRLGVVDFLSKPISADDLSDAIHRATRLGGKVGREDREASPPDDAGLIGASSVMARLRERIARFGPLTGTVLICGETGSGKERVAAALHAASGRGGLLVPVNCAALPEALAESELFGHVRGAFTDARSDRAGLMREAQGGTLFLDEIGDLPLPLQPKLLRALETRAVRPVGGSSEIGIDARVVAATHRDLEAMAGRGSFREDLYFRLAELRIEIPPLRARADDIPELARRFLAEIAAREGLAVSAISAEAMDMLRAWRWPGNVRELRHVIYEAAVLCDGSQIEIEDLPARLLSAIAPEASGLPSPALSLDEIERAHIERVLASVGGNRTEAARILGCDRKTLYRRLKALHRASA